MAICMLITALIVKYIPTESSTAVTAAGKATVAMIYLDIMVREPPWILRNLDRASNPFCADI